MNFARIISTKETINTFITSSSESNYICNYEISCLAEIMGLRWYQTYIKIIFIRNLLEEYILQYLVINFKYREADIYKCMYVLFEY